MLRPRDLTDEQWKSSIHSKPRRRRDGRGRPWKNRRSVLNGILWVLRTGATWADQLAQCRPRHRHQEYLSFLREIEKSVPKNLEAHIIVDNYATHKHRRVRRWFATRPRFHVHFTPTYASWLNQVEIWFNRITQQAIRRGTFGSVKELVEKIDRYVQNSNRHARAFVWTATAESIFAKVKRLCEGISGTAH